MYLVPDKTILRPHTGKVSADQSSLGPRLQDGPSKIPRSGEDRTQAEEHPPTSPIPSYQRDDLERPKYAPFAKTLKTSTSGASLGQNMRSRDRTSFKIRSNSLIFRTHFYHTPRRTTLADGWTTRCDGHDKEDRINGAKPRESP